MTFDPPVTVDQPVTFDPAASGLRVLEIGESVAAAIAGMVLADNGADVVILEPPGREPSAAIARVVDVGQG